MFGLVAISEVSRIITLPSGQSLVIPIFFRVLSVFLSVTSPRLLFFVRPNKYSPLTSASPLGLVS